MLYVLNITTVFFSFKKKQKKPCNVVQTNIFLIFLWRPQYGTVIKQIIVEQENPI